MQQLTHILARNLKAAMQAAEGGHGISQAKLARLSGVGQTTISLMLRPYDRYTPLGKGSSSPTVERIAMLARTLGCEPWELLHPDPARAKRERQFYEQIRRDFAHLLPARSKEKV